jgi:hypothetical protein
MDGQNIPHGGPEMLRACICEMAGFAQEHTKLVMHYAELGDDVGLSYAMRRWVAYTRAAADTLKELRAMKEAEGFQ